MAPFFAQAGIAPRAAPRFLLPPAPRIRAAALGNRTDPLGQKNRAAGHGAASGDWGTGVGWDAAFARYGDPLRGDVDVG